MKLSKNKLSAQRNQRCFDLSAAIPVTATLAEVLRAQPPSTLRDVPPLAISPASAAGAVVESAAKTVRAMYYADLEEDVKLKRAGKRKAASYSRESFFDACADTRIVEFDVVSVLDDVAAAIAGAIFKAAGWYSSSLKPTTLRAQVEIQAFVIETVRKLRVLLAKQQNFAFAGA